MTITHYDQDLALPGRGSHVAATLRTPADPKPDAALLINLSNTRVRALNENPFDIIPADLLAAGHYVASFDLPNHGSLEDQHGGGLTGMAVAMASGVDVFGQIVADARAVVATVGTRRVFVAGTSRGGLAAMHVMAALPEVAGAAVIAPVTNLALLIEFESLENLDLCRRSGADALSERLLGRPMFVAVGPADHRVGTEPCVAFSRAVGAQLHLDEAARGHRVSDAAHHLAAAFLLKLAAGESP